MMHLHKMRYIFFRLSWSWLMADEDEDEELQTHKYV